MTEMQMQEYAREARERLQNRIRKTRNEITDAREMIRDCQKWTRELTDVELGTSTLTHEGKLDALREGSIDV